MSDAPPSSDPADLFSETLASAIAARGLTLQRLQARLEAAGVPVSLSTLSYWRSGRSRPERTESLRAIRVLETVLDLPSGSLLQLAFHTPKTRASRGRPRPVAFERLWAVESVAVSTILDSWGTPARPSCTKLGLHENLRVNDQRLLTTVAIREVLRAREEPVMTAFTALRGGPGGRPPHLTRWRNCTPGRVVEVAEFALTVAELHLDRVLATGDTAVLEYEFDLVDPVPDQEYDRRFTSPVGLYVVELEFSEQDPPAACHTYRVDDRAGFARIPGDAVPLAARTAHVVRTAIPPGIHGIDWAWAENPASQGHKNTTRRK